MTLGCVAIPLLGSDIGPDLAHLFDLWADPRFRPMLTPRQDRPRLLIVANSAAPGLLAEAERLFLDRPVLQACFAGIEVHSAGLEGERDFYRRGTRGPAGRYGNRAGPNFLFQETMRLAEAHGGYALQIELDCLPVQAGWIEAVEAVIAANAGAWVIGSVFAGRGNVDRSISLHLNGNALYRAGDPVFMLFLERHWFPGMVQRAAQVPNLAYDCWWSLERDQVDVRTENESWQLVRTHDCFFRNEPFVVNLLDDETRLSDYAATFERFVALDRMPVFFHGPAMKAMTRALLDHADDSMLDAIHRVDPDPARAAVPRALRRAGGPGVEGVWAEGGGDPDADRLRDLATLLRSSNAADRRRGMALLAARLLIARTGACQPEARPGDLAKGQAGALAALLAECLARAPEAADGAASDPYRAHLEHVGAHCARLSARQDAGP